MFSQSHMHTARTLAVLSASLLGSVAAAHAQTDVLTWHNDAARTGQNLTESLLTPTRVNSTNFGLLRNFPVDGKVDAQPLYVSALNIPGKGSHNVLFIATEHDSVYAVDADTGVTYWQRSLLGAGETPSDPRNCDQVVPEIGITATPAIDRQTGPNGTIYLVAMSKDASSNYYQRIHSLNLATGAEQTNSPVTVQATYPGTGDNSSNGNVVFDAKQYKERPGLLILNGNLYTSWGSHCDIEPYTGWMMTYDKNTLAQTAVLDFIPNGSDGAPWNAGAGPAADEFGNVYVALGNGTFDTTLNLQGFPSKSDFGNSMVKLNYANNRLNILDYWTMYNTVSQSNQDIDLGSGGLMVLPDIAGYHFAIAAGKDSNLYVANRDNMGHFNPNSNSSLYAELPGALPGGSWAAPAYFNGYVYYSSVNNRLRAFSVYQNGYVSSVTSASFGYPGTTPSVSAYGTYDAIVWAVENAGNTVLHAYNPANLANEFYNSTQAGTRDQSGPDNKFIVPTIANGKVFVGTTNSVATFGYLRQVAAPLADGDFAITNSATKLVAENTASGGSVDQAASVTADNQRWFLSFNGLGYFNIQNVGGHFFLTSAAGSSTAVDAWPTNDDTQLWSLVSVTGGFVIKNKATGLVLDGSGSTQTGSAIALVKASGAASQTWSIQ